MTPYGNCWFSEPYISDREEHYDVSDPDYVSPAIRAASRALAASAPLLSTDSPDDARLIDGFSIVFGPPAVTATESRKHHETAHHASRDRHPAVPASS